MHIPLITTIVHPLPSPPLFACLYVPKYTYTPSHMYTYSHCAYDCPLLTSLSPLSPSPSLSLPCPFIVHALMVLIPLLWNAKWDKNRARIWTTLQIVLTIMIIDLVTAIIGLLMPHLRIALRFHNRFENRILNRIKN